MYVMTHSGFSEAGVECHCQSVLPAVIKMPELIRNIFASPHYIQHYPQSRGLGVRLLKYPRRRVNLVLAWEYYYPILNLSGSISIEPMDCSIKLGIPLSIIKFQWETPSPPLISYHQIGQYKSHHQSRPVCCLKLSKSAYFSISDVGVSDLRSPQW